MRHSIKKSSGSQIELTVTLSRDEFKPYWENAQKSAVSRVTVKGFRAGTAPRELAEATVDPDKVFDEATEKAIHAALKKLTEENQWTLVDTPRAEVLDTKDLGMTFKATLTLFPEVTLGNYKKIAKRVMQESHDRLKELSVTPEEIEKSVEWLRKSRGANVFDDASVQKLGPNFKNVDDAKKSIHEGILLEKRKKETERARTKILEELVRVSFIDVPQIMVEKTLSNMLRDFHELMKSQNMTEADFREKFRGGAEHHVKCNLIIQKILEKEHLDPTEEEVITELKKRNLDPDKFYDYSYGIVANQKVFTFLENQ